MVAAQFGGNLSCNDQGRSLLYSSYLNLNVMDLPLYGPSRRTRGGSISSSSNQVASCLVDGCNSDLSKCRDYHRRHKVCEVHSKTPKVIIRGEEQRFCQQCSRFHSLVEFDDVKRSCRKRLDGHNRRRRKSQPESSLLNPTQFLSDFQDAATYFQTTGPQVYPTSSTASHSWLGAVKPRTGHDYEMSLNFSDKKEQTQFPFLQATPPLLRAPSSISSSALEPNGEGYGQELFLGTVCPESNRALSLLSSLQQPHTEASSLEKGISFFNNSQPRDYSYDRRVGMDHELVSQGGVFFQVRHDALNSNPSSWED